MPQGWRLLGETTSNVVFVDESADEIHFSWNRTQQPVEKPVCERFIQLTMVPAPVTSAEVRSTVQRIFAPMGELVTAASIETADGVRAVELEESFINDSTGGEWCGYQFILQSPTSPFSAARFERIAFFAPVKEFHARINQIKGATESFSYA